MDSKKPYGLISDVHLHNWSAFSTVLDSGINFRLANLLNEIGRCAKEVANAGGDTIYIAGDLFHVRGSIAPSVLNPTLAVFETLIAGGFKVRAIPGNHDLEGKHSCKLGSAVESLRTLGVEVVSETTVFEDDRVVMIPWFMKLDALKAELESHQNPEYDVIIHAPVNGVLNIPDHGLDVGFLKKLEYRNIFSGHYHNHKNFDNKVYSIGALAQHTWSDVGSKAGFLIVYPEGQVRWMKSHLPEFVDIADIDSVDDIELIVPGNFVRVKVDPSIGSVEGIREELTKMGAAGVVINPLKKPSAKREGSVVASTKSGASLEVSVAEYAKSQFPDCSESVVSECMSVLSEAGC